MKLKTLFTICIVTISLQANSKLLDKIQAVFNEKVITLSQVKRIKNSIAARRNIIPQIYHSTKMTNKEILEKEIQKFIVRNKLEVMGLIVTDKEVEDSIADREQKLGVTRTELIKFLDQNNLTFDEYFELTREAIEHQKFIGWVIRPLVSVTDQEIKNYYYKNSKNKQTIAFSYNLVNFTIPKSKIKNKSLLKKDLINFQQNGVLPDYLKELETNPLGHIGEDGLTSKIKKALSGVNENEFSNPILINGYFNVFFIKEKKLIESEDFKRSKQRIQNILIGKQIVSISKTWFESEKNKFYIKYFF
jgi:peptidyl-prolyl cis-trans isomerase SurA